MEYEFRVTPKSGYLHVRVTGDNTPEIVMKYLQQLYATCMKENCPNVLVEENLEWPGLALGEIFGLVSDGSRNAWPVVHRIAYVDTNPRHELKDMKFAETAANNRSINVRVFGEVQEAENWLVRQLNSPPGKS